MLPCISLSCGFFSKGSRRSSDSSSEPREVTLERFLMVSGPDVTVLTVSLASPTFVSSSTGQVQEKKKGALHNGAELQ
uniref:Uncharacterized protein n=1 Tax=Glossina pallidipes TaxID=7398 RepID=A0A1B0GGM4_GLOPL